MSRLAGIVLTLFMLAGLPGASAAELSHEEEIRDWRERRHERLSSEDGWLTLVGLEWLEEGENRIGSLAGSTVSITGGPEDWGTLHVQGDEFRYVPMPGVGITVNGEEVDEVKLVADIQGEPSVVRSGNLSFMVIFRQSYALRVKDSQASALKNFDGVPNFDFQEDWKYDAHFIPAPEGESMEVANVLGQLVPSAVYGYVEFKRDGKTHRLLGLGDEDSESLWFLFADRTSGRETYGAGRYLYSDGMPEGGKLVIDFNKAYNPPCVFSEYATCPLPPQQNRLDLAVTAGEKDYHAH